MDNSEGKQPDSIKPGPPADTPRKSPPPVAEAPDAEAEGFFTSTNIILLGMMAALVFYLLYKFHLEEMWNIGKAVLGLSFVIFIHEMGHFLAAKWSDVNVTTFSIGFGPPIPGCSFTWGETTYKLAVIPLGGYVQMVGQVDGDEQADGSDDDPRSYKNKSVGARMLIISAGVIMNAILAVICFIIVYMGPGKEHPAGVIGATDSAAPASKAGIRTGAKIVSFGGKEDANFTDLMQIVINSQDNEKIPITTQFADGKTTTTEIEALVPKQLPNAPPPRPMIGVTSPSKLQLATRRQRREGPYVAGTPAAEAGFEPADKIIATTDPDNPKVIKDLSDDWRFPKHGQRDYFEFVERMNLLADQEVTIRVERTDEHDKKETVDLKIAPAFHVDLGVRMQMGPVLAVRHGSPADGTVYGPRSAEPDKKLQGDVIEAVKVAEADGKVLEFKDDKLDPERLPTQLRQWSDRLDKAKFAGKREVTLKLQRHSDKGGPQFVPVEITLEWKTDWRFDRVSPISPNSPLAIPELGLAYQIKSTVAGKRSADSPLQVGDTIKNIRYEIEGPPEQTPEFRALLYTVLPFLRPEANSDVKSDWFKSDIEEGQWAHISWGHFSSAVKYKKIVFKVERSKEIQEIELPIAVDKDWPLAERGWWLMGDTRRVKASDPVHAVAMGFADTTARMMEVFQNLRGMIMGRISVRNLGGPLTIARATYIFAGMDFGEFVFFLGLISINLAVVNFLPIPVLDGGHMVFLIYEGVRRKPASEAVRIYATYAGLAVIACLMIFVLYLDVTRLFF